MLDESLAISTELGMRPLMVNFAQAEAVRILNHLANWSLPVKFKIGAGSIRRIGNSRIVLRMLYYTWVAFPYPIRKPLTSLFIL